MRKVLSIALLGAVALFLVACGGGSSGSSGSSTTSGSSGGAEAGDGSHYVKTPAQVWAKEVEGVMREFENSSAHAVEAIHTLTAQFHLEPTYATYSDELAKLGKQLEATHPPAECRQLRDKMGAFARKVSQIMGVLGDQSELSPEEFSALAYQQGYKFSRVGRKLTNMTVHPHC